jgi:cytochrome c oxidase cbb3-type subunit 3
MKNLIKKIIIKIKEKKMAEVEDKIIEGHNYDGIKEYDNPLPPWWVYLFIITIIWAVGYMYYYHVSDWGPSSDEEYQASLIPTDEQLVAQTAGVWKNLEYKVRTEEEQLAEGKQIFVQNCVSCHRNDGGGGIGPNLTDENWIHGGSFKDIARTIIEGVPEKGMVSWKPLLTPDGIMQVSSYIDVKLRNTNVANGKAPQGEVYVPVEEEEPKEELQAEGSEESNTDESTEN